MISPLLSPSAAVLGLYFPTYIKYIIRTSNLNSPSFSVEPFPLFLSLQFLMNNPSAAALVPPQALEPDQPDHAPKHSE